jgi:hypothetical protein
MATFPQPLTDVQTLTSSPCPHCCRRQAQPEAAALSDLAPAPSFVAGSRPGAALMPCSHLMRNRPCFKERKGKERKGKERKGKERKGKER